ncbi:phosphocarrier protein HPr /phosphoenolpyruvate--protein phosphotransferase /dihydroxyacetone kinase DhaM subunit [Motilibacter rhizosphaerae]|uniref:Phosphocarrier protein HPr n=1 Tax=Motilibacter rhizosphaerae TaxID=598652 RepID=A0A4Q7NQN6_9ACTN|nr:dihydroxyacetone kinase phosphoryl donor subunit DhaM [Motilibacter rhizosphaerae]RZS89367.1 phosphocarrier protein HPr /phosphoenolpyruvate--protein phosphotransferase /dihydroxyacetone kinase DhaM subunit [Motilibacter rhizosphaerae]
MPERVGLVVVSHVAGVAAGVVELVAQMAPDVVVVPAGGTDDGGIGTSFDLVLAALEQAEHGDGAVVVYDLGSALLTAESALELLDDDRRGRVRIADGPLVEGALAAAVAAQGGADLAAVALAARGASGTGAEPLTSSAGRSAVLVNPLGLHARPAAVLVRALEGRSTEVRVGRPGGPYADARSLLGVVGLALRGGDEVEVQAAGADAEEVVAALVALLSSGFGEDGEAVEAPPAAGGTPTCGAPGLAVGSLRRLPPATVRLPEEADRDPAVEQGRLDAALAAAGRAAAGELAEAHRALLGDAALTAPAGAAVGAGASAERAWWEAVTAARERLAAGDELVAGRAADVLDVGLAVLAALDPGCVPAPDLAGLAGAVVVAEDLVPSQVPALAAAGAAGAATAGGAPTAHASLLARGLGLPLLVGCGPGVLDLPEGAAAVLDADAGTLLAPAGPEAVATAEERVRRGEAERREAARTARAPVVLPDGRVVRVEANVASAAEAAAAREGGADGIGLLRTELLWLGRSDLPDEDEQVALLRAVLAELPGRPVVVRTLDVGGDKDLPALHLDPARSGFLGERGLRHGLAHPELLRTQLRAVARAAYAHDGEVGVMAPMVTFADEVQAFLAALDEAVASLGGADHRRPDRVGVMVEVPAAALAVDEVAAGLDFVSVGTNDLVQYLVAAERTLPAVAHLHRPDATAVWRVLEQVVRGATAAGATVAVCGNLAADPQSARRLVALGVGELSVPPPAVAAVKAALR